MAKKKRKKKKKSKKIRKTRKQSRKISKSRKKTRKTSKKRRAKSRKKSKSRSRKKIRKINLIPSEMVPYQTPLGPKYDSGNFIKNLEDALKISDWSNFEAWEEAGAVWTQDRANKIWKNILDNFEAPPIDETINEQLKDFVSKRISEGGAPTDF